MSPMKSLNFLSILFRIPFGLWFVFVVIWPADGLRPLRERARSWGEEVILIFDWLPQGKEENELGPFSSWNITGTYKGNWKFLISKNSSSKYPGFTNSNGNSVLELISTPTRISGVHYVQGLIIFHDVYENGKDVRGAQIKVEGVYIWPFRQLRMLVNSGKSGDVVQEDDYLFSTPYHLIGIFSSQLFLESPRDKIWKGKHSPIYGIEKQCNIEIAAQISRLSSIEDGGDEDKYYLEGLMESPSMDDDADCFSPMLLNATSGTAKISLLMIGHQAILDTYICILHLTAGIVVDSLFNAFATATFFKFVVFSLFEMRYLLAIWKANRPPNGENWDTMRRELSALHSRFYAILLGGVVVMYVFHKIFRFILLLLHSFWIPQICLNVIRNSRKPLRPLFILGMTITRMAIPFTISEPDVSSLILPDTYGYYRRFNQKPVEALDCVICMNPIELDQLSSDCMFSDPVRSFLSPEVSSTLVGRKNGMPNMSSPTSTFVESLYRSCSYTNSSRSTSVYFVGEWD
ncbi:hypothetical protein CASFOL_008069 [Castilleja foliolosa]|uniref:RING-type E3 ubiquitin transferase n=1 Tax=Castilleja foliolosa TaxID=1961234 RepID=A0ABD3DZ74_9LAMI